MVRDAATGDDVEKIAVYGRVDVQTVHRWLKAYPAGAVAALADRPRSGHPPAPGEADWAEPPESRCSDSTPPIPLYTPKNVRTCA